MLIAIEGIDGAGKHTQASLLAEGLFAAGRRAELVSFPRYGESFFSVAIEELLKGRFGGGNDPRLVGLLFAGDRLEGRRHLLDSLAANDVVIADRYVASNLAYQGARAPGEEQQEVMRWLAHVEHDVYGLPRPELTVLLDLPVEVAVRRLSTRASSGGRPDGDVYEADHAFLERCRRCYLELAAALPDWAVVTVAETGGERSIEAIGDEVLALAVTRLGR